MATQADELVKEFQSLPAAEQVKAAEEIQKQSALPPPSSGWAGPLWLVVILTFCALLLGGTWLLYELVRDDQSTEVIAPLVTGALGVLAGLLAPSPVSRS